MVHGCMVYAGPEPRRLQFHVTPAMPALQVHHFGGYSKTRYKANQSCRATCERYISDHQSIKSPLPTPLFWLISPCHQHSWRNGQWTFLMLKASLCGTTTSTTWTCAHIVLTTSTTWTCVRTVLTTSTYTVLAESKYHLDMCACCTD